VVNSNPCGAIWFMFNLNARYMNYKNLKLKDAFKLAMNDMTDELCLAWQPVNDYIIDNTLQDLAVKFSNNLIEHDRVLYYNVDWQQPVSKTYLNTKEQRQLNSKLGITKNNEIMNWYKN
jgi:hypothetical protein